MSRESTARRDVRHTSAASCRICCTENSFPHHWRSPLADGGSRKSQTTGRTTPSISDRRLQPTVCGLELDSSRERPTFAAWLPPALDNRAHCHDATVVLPQWIRTRHKVYIRVAYPFEYSRFHLLRQRAARNIGLSQLQHAVIQFSYFEQRYKYCSFYCITARVGIVCPVACDIINKSNRLYLINNLINALPITYTA